MEDFKLTNFAQQQHHDFTDRTITYSQVNYLWRVPEENATLQEVLVLGHDN